MIETIKNTSVFEQSRRQFITKILPASALCLGCGKLLSSAFAGEKPEVQSAQHKFIKNSGMSFKEVFDFAYKESYIPNMKSLQKQIGKENFIEMLKIAGSEYGKQFGQYIAKDIGKNDMLSFASYFVETEFYKNIVTWEVVEKTEKAFEIHYTECLWADTFREADAIDIGYAGMCHMDFALAPAFNPSMKLIRTKTLMQGNERCNFRFIMEA